MPVGERAVLDSVLCRGVSSGKHSSFAKLGGQVRVAASNWTRFRASVYRAGFQAAENRAVVHACNFVDFRAPFRTSGLGFSRCLDFRVSALFSNFSSTGGSGPHGVAVWLEGVDQKGAFLGCAFCHAKSPGGKMIFSEFQTAIVLQNCVFDCPKEDAVNAEARIDVDASNSFGVNECRGFPVAEIGVRPIRGGKLRCLWDIGRLASWAYVASLTGFAALFCVKALLCR
jgi:hypothetical protein